MAGVELGPVRAASQPMRIGSLAAIAGRAMAADATPRATPPRVKPRRVRAKAITLLLLPCVGSLHGTGRWFPRLPRRRGRFDTSRTSLRLTNLIARGTGRSLMWIKRHGAAELGQLGHA